MLNVVDQTRLPDTEPFAKKTTPPSVPTITPRLGKTAGAARTAVAETATGTHFISPVDISRATRLFESVKTNTRVSSIEILLVKHELNQKEECDHKSKPEDALIAYTL